MDAPDVAAAKAAGWIISPTDPTATDNASSVPRGNRGPGSNSGSSSPIPNSPAISQSTSGMPPSWTVSDQAQADAQVSADKAKAIGSSAPQPQQVDRNNWNAPWYDWDSPKDPGFQATEKAYNSGSSLPVVGANAVNDAVGSMGSDALNMAKVVARLIANPHAALSAPPTPQISSAPAPLTTPSPSAKPNPSDPVDAPPIGAVQGDTIPAGKQPIGAITGSSSPQIDPTAIAQQIASQSTASPLQQVPHPSLWTDLPAWRQAQLVNEDPTNPDPAGAYNRAVMASNPGLTPATPDTTMQLASRGILPANSGHTLDMGQAAQMLNQRMQSFYGGGGQGGGMVQTLADAQGIPYAKIMPIFNPTTGAMEMKQIDIPADARNTVSGLPQGALSSITDLGDKFASQELPKAFYGQIAPKYQSIVNLLNEAKQTGDYNNFRSMDVLNSYAGITRPGAVVRDSTIATDLEGSGLPNEIARHWEAFVKGEGVLSQKDLTQIAASAKDSYNGYKSQVELAKRPALAQAHLRTGLPMNTLDQLMFPPSPGDQENTSQEGDSTGNTPSVTGPNDPVYQQLPKGAIFTHNGKQFQKH